MVKDIKVYMDLFQAEPSPGTVELGELINEVLDRLKEEETNENVPVDISITSTALLCLRETARNSRTFFITCFKTVWKL
ncbi:MAG: hypothetical protein MZU91_06225 [Desulfosudis oleivorans]|nr:hypothetical protein [Desulfosudis oleivorans]